MTETTPSLAQLQQDFQAAILDLQASAPDFIKDSAQASAAARFQVYTNAYRLRLIDALSLDYPALKASLGDTEFQQLGYAYIDAAPSDQFSIRWFGRHMPDFLAEAPAYAGQLALQELAMFQWGLSEAFDAPDYLDKQLDEIEEMIEGGDLYQRFAAIPPQDWPRLRLRFHPSLNRLDLYSNAPQVWLATDQNQIIPELFCTDQVQLWSIWRQDFKLLFRSLSSEEAFAVDAFRHGQCFSQVCSGLCALLPEDQVAIKAAGFLQAWLRDGWVTGFEMMLVEIDV
jgi:hypothetical protein